MKQWLAIVVLAGAVAACSRAPAPGQGPQSSMAPTNTAYGPAGAYGPGVVPASEAHDPPAQIAAKQCASYGLQPGSDDYKNCVSGMTETLQDARDDANDAQEDRADEQRDRAADTDRDTSPGQGPSRTTNGCVTTHQGSNTSTVCP